MHEHGVTEEILKNALHHAESAGAPKITEVYVVLGRLSNVTQDSVQFYWEVLSKGTAAEGARLHFRDISPEMECTDCGRRFCPGGEETACPQCGATNARLVAGQEFYLEAIDVE